MFAGWKLVAEEVKHPNSSYLQAVVSSVLGKRIPFHSNLKLTEWYSQNKGQERWRVIFYRLTQGMACLLLLDALDIVGRSGEAARLSGVEFSQSFPGIRGSQYKVEGVLLRALKSLNSYERGSKHGHKVVLSCSNKASSSSLSSESPSQALSPWKVQRQSRTEDDGTVEPLHNFENRSYFFFSPSNSATDKQEALEAQALTLEPQSGHQTDPVVVCDFTALYPSLVIAYNLCYSTLAGRLSYHTTRKEMKLAGKTTEKVGPVCYSELKSAAVLKHHLRSLGCKSRSDRAYVAPNGAIYVSESVLKGALPQVLDEILRTRAMIKKAAKLYKKCVKDLSPAILRQLEARQLALKYVANVTYGYTSATFSGRCALPLLADTIVECGRRTLTNAINLANSWGKDIANKWYGCQVLYGDTDSVFIKLPGRTVQEAFCFGEEYCQAVTASNPPPVQLKLEKVYLGSILQTKKKYCGMKFESKDQVTPTFEAKGLETIRRDQCALTQKILRNSLIVLFQQGLPSVRSYLVRQWTKIMVGSVPVSDFILTARVRRNYRGRGPVQKALASRLQEADPGLEILHKQRIAFVIVASPGVQYKLRDCVLTPMELLEQWDAYSIHLGYYITRHVNTALQRCLGLAPHYVNIHQWFAQCPKPRQRIHFWPVTRSGNSAMISSYFGSDMCSICGVQCQASGRSKTAICSTCRHNHTVISSTTAISHLQEVTNEAQRVAQRCHDCNNCFEDWSTFGQSTKDSTKVGSMHRQEIGIHTPLANCTCIDCPTTFERHRLREAQIEATSLCQTLDLA